MSIYEHFRDDEHAFVDQVLDWKEIVTAEYRFKLTDFLDPRQQYILESLVGAKDEIHVDFWGGHEFAERKRAILYPDYVELEKTDYQISAYELIYPAKFVSIEHRNVLGSLMSIGMKREKFGDILSDEERYQIMMSEEVADYILVNLDSVGKAKVKLEKVDTEELISQNQEVEKRFLTASSMRLDVIVAEAFRLPRSKVKPVVTAEKVKVNWKTVTNASFSLQKGDVLSVRGHGRCEILELEGETKKGRQRIVLGFPK